MGLDIDAFTRDAQDMRFACNDDDAHENPGAKLGIALGVAHKAGKDKLTIVTSDSIYDLGAWMEQLIAESTGKSGVSIIPVDQEALMNADSYGDDRIFAVIKCGEDEKLDELAAELKSASIPVVEIAMESELGIGQEFFRWEIATAVAGSIMEINPFNQPDVESAKIEARKITDAFEETGELPLAQWFTEDAAFALDGDTDVITNAQNTSSCAEVIKAHLGRTGVSDYIALLAYVEMNVENAEVLSEIRKNLNRKYNVATSLGFGPRFLHSTGQAHKGGANNGVFLQITANEDIELEVPGQKYSFGVIKEAQARGDFEVLKERGRRSLHVHLKNGVAEGLQSLLKVIS